MIDCRSTPSLEVIERQPHGYRVLNSRDAWQKSRSLGFGMQEINSLGTILRQRDLKQLLCLTDFLQCPRSMYYPGHMEDRERQPKEALIVTAGNEEPVSTMTAERLDRLSLLAVGQSRGNGSTAFKRR